LRASYENAGKIQVHNNKNVEAPLEQRKQNQLVVENKALKKRIEAGQAAKKELKTLKEPEAKLLDQCSNLHNEFTRAQKQLKSKAEALLKMPRPSLHN